METCTSKVPRVAQVVADMTPLSATPASFRTANFAGEGSGRLTFTPNLGWAPWFMAATLAVAASLSLVAAILGPWNGIDQALFILWPLCLFFGITVADRWLRVATTTFDLNDRQVRHRIRFRRRRWTLDTVLAVQLLSGVIYSSDDGPDMQQYQLNIVLDDAHTPRLNISNHPELSWTRETGKQLAEFLKVPFLDHLAPAA